MFIVTEDTSDGTAPRRLPLGLSPAIPRILLILALAGIFVGLWPPNRNADGRQRCYGEGVEVSRVDLALRAVGIRRFAEKTGRLPVDLAEARSLTPTLQEWVAWADDLPRRDDYRNDPIRISDRIEEPWSPYGAWYYHDAGVQPPVPDPDLDVIGLPITYDCSKPLESPEFSVLSSDPLPSGVLEYLESQGGVPAEAPQPFSLSSATLISNLEVVRDAKRKRWGAWVPLLGGIAVWILAWVLVRRVWRSYESGRAGRVTVKVMSVIAGLAAVVGLLGTGATCYSRATFTTRRLNKEKRLGLLDAAVQEGKIRKDVAERARRYIRELP